MCCCHIKLSIYKLAFFIEPTTGCLKHQAIFGPAFDAVPYSHGENYFFASTKRFVNKAECDCFHLLRTWCNCNNSHCRFNVRNCHLDHSGFLRLLTKCFFETTKSFSPCGSVKSRQEVNCSELCDESLSYLPFASLRCRFCGTGVNLKL